jgi:hypothetical protein
MEARCVDLSGDTVFGAKDARRAWDSLCLVTGDGLLAAAEGNRRSAGGSTVFLRSAGLVVVTGFEAVATDTLRLEEPVVPGEGESVLLNTPSTDAGVIDLVPLSSSQGSLFAVVRGVSFLRSGGGIVFDGVFDVFDAASTLPSISTGESSLVRGSSNYTRELLKTESCASLLWR